MDYSKLAAELLHEMQRLQAAALHKLLDESIRGEAFALRYIACHSGEALPGDIGVEMNVSSARIAQTLNSLEKKGLIVRQIDKNDRRRILISLTPEGEEMAEKHWSTTSRIAGKMLELLGEKDAQEYVRITAKLADAVHACGEF